ncbi:hypothetical protein GGTG_13702 [Gaeumannomyces tritici R3-111a-1]|uniref:Uncharacterized protein n=1 Tax=Gaeumannomyces tritici (strain R3-111a-1) TaxID=644352 RepID=J3PJL5_GAET3|nr:hypothetical protein GGTG_13702 [Gaeumannomyces tritici R3-111a-1]EJT68728.1 hypothetical protein GGTG_13702 [Gaeumannomyces tritici R3-111a-1]
MMQVKKLLRRFRPCKSLFLNEPPAVIDGRHDVLCSKAFPTPPCDSLLRGNFDVDQGPVDGSQAPCKGLPDLLPPAVGPGDVRDVWQRHKSNVKADQGPEDLVKVTADRICTPAKEVGGGPGGSILPTDI